MEDSEGHSAAAMGFETHVLPEIDVLYRVARARTRNAINAEDLVQETLPGVAAHDPSQRAHQRPSPQGSMLLHDSEAVSVIADRAGAPGAESVVIDRTFSAVVERAYLDLPDVFREVIDLVDLGGLTYDDAAAVLGIPQGTVMSRLHRGRKRIRDTVGEDRAVGAGEVAT